jgi:hypothetical protein
LYFVHHSLQAILPEGHGLAASTQLCGTSVIAKQASQTLSSLIVSPPQFHNRHLIASCESDQWFLLCSHMIETPRRGHADHRPLRLGPTRRDKSIREYKARIELDLATLIWTRGAVFPVSMLEGRLKCPRCGSRRVVVLFDLPATPISKRA